MSRIYIYTYISYTILTDRNVYGMTCLNITELALPE